MLLSFTGCDSSDKKKEPVDESVNIYNQSDTSTVGNIANAGTAFRQGEWVYFSDSSGHLVKTKLDGSEKKILSKDTPRFITVVGDWIYYSNTTDGNKLYKIKTDGKGEEKLNDDKSMYPNVNGGWIYYANRSKGDSIYKLRLDGSNKKMLDKDGAKYLNISGDWIYYSNTSDKDKLYRIKIDGSKKQNYMMPEAGIR
jgi:uncharacterized protein YchJ